jgi:disulfide bond formation protein DsbB
MNPDTVHYLNMFLGAGAIVLQILALVSLFLLFFTDKKHSFLKYVEKHFLIIGFFISLFGSLFSLVYSEVINFAPCMLCWYQRIFLYPLVFIFGVAFWNKDKKIIRYVLPLLSVGFVVSVYQNFRYYFGETGNLPCDASGISCYQQLVSEYGGYISIPMLALTAFFILIVLVLIGHFVNKENS